MSEITLGIIGGGQLGSMLAIAAKKLNVKTVIFCDDVDAPAQNFCNQFVTGSYDNKEKISEFINQVDLVTYEFENIPYETLNEINKFLKGVKVDNIKIFDVLSSMNSKTSYGGTATKNIKNMIRKYKKEIK